MAKHTRQSHYREDLSETPEWLKKKKCPHRDKFLSGKRILPKNLTGKEALPQVVDEVFLAYNSARLKEGCQLFADSCVVRRRRRDPRNPPTAGQLPVNGLVTASAG